ncbi:hypothetical protein FH972_024935 [Carpinus fangiana]|uniref:Uncharacterized protein n=1 Tax=Carpinus fangiana TaxID=176857 RepID=A0A5N6L224_9ROSI|nr:hypothetical protein FH972_024935 [Carpinus fangiana]
MTDGLDDDNDENASEERERDVPGMPENADVEESPPIQIEDPVPPSTSHSHQEFAKQPTEGDFVVPQAKRRKTFSGAWENSNPALMSSDAYSLRSFGPIHNPFSPLTTQSSPSSSHHSDNQAVVGAAFHTILGQSPSISANTPKTVYRESTRPSKSIEQVRLIRYFIDHVAHYFDLCDSQRHFASTIPTRASSHPLLQEAVMAVAARHMSIMGAYDNFAADALRQECLSPLLQLLHNKDSGHDGNLLAAAVLIRHLFLLDIPLSGNTLEVSALAMQVFLDAQERLALGGQLNEPTYWTALQQELHVALVSQKPVNSHFVFDQATSMLPPTDDYSWTKRIIAHCAKVANYCFGDFDRDAGPYDVLVAYATDWMSQKPACFRPAFYRDPKDRTNVFPEILMLNDHAVSALQYFHLATILLSAYDPRLPRMGIQRKRMLEMNNVSVKCTL